MSRLCLLLASLLVCAAGHAANASSARPAPRAVTSSGAGQAGYVHYFLITHPNGELEYQVGIELDDQRVAWSFPDAGAIVSPFVKKGSIEANGKTFKIEHLHGIRPFSADKDMQAFQKVLPQRVAYWIDNETPYCLLRRPGEPFCLSCGDFVVRILWPSAHPLIPALPPDFIRSTGFAYTTDDLLIYLVGLHDLPDRYSMVSRLAKLEIPEAMREDLLAMIGPTGNESPPSNVANAPKPPVVAPVTRAAPVVQSPPGKSVGRIATRRTQGKKI